MSVRENRPKIYKPEISVCPFCESKLKYRYAVSNKVIQFSHGEKRLIRNLGYSCSNDECPHKELIYTSQTASKLCIKGYTYSTKILGLIMYYKMIHKSREAILNILSNDNIDISDRNIDIIFKKLKKLYEMDYKKNIEETYKDMLDKYGTIMLSIDAILLQNGYRVISVKSFYTSEYIGIHINRFKEDSDYDFLDDYLNKNLNISLIVTVRPGGQFYPQIKKRVRSSCKFTSYIKI